MSVLKGCEPRKEVLKGDLDDAIFAADFGDLIAGKAPSVYQDPHVFFQNTHPAEQLKKVVDTVFNRLANAREGGATIRLSTGFGGGKTHTLMALWHLAHNITDPSMGTEVLPAAGRPRSVTVVGIDASKAGVPDFAQHGKRKVKSLWGELAFRFGGEDALKKMGDSDDPERHPDESLIEKLLPSGPVLILLDELVVYMSTLSDRGQGSFLAVINKITSIVSKRPQTVLVITDPGEQMAYARESARIAENTENAAMKLGSVLGRKVATGFDPIGDESARIISRRLFNAVDPSAAQSASATYHTVYERVHTELPGSIPPIAASSEYARKIVDCYPFHPRLMETAQGRLGALQEFNKSRGILRLFARIIRDVWEAKSDCDLITAGDIDWSSDRIQADLLQRLNRDNFKAAVTADINTHAIELDGGKRGIHVRVASALLLESIPMQTNSGLDPADLTLAVLRPEEAGQEPGEAINRLAGVCWHTYPMPGGRGWQFRYEPNIIKQIEERMSDVPLDDARSRMKTEAQGYFSGPTFKLSSWPQTPSQVPDSMELQLALCDDEATAKSVCAFSDTKDPKAPIPRQFVNAIVAVTTQPGALAQAIEMAQRLLAADAIERDNRTGEGAKLIREQLQRIRPQLQKRFRVQTCRAFDRIILSGGSIYSLDEHYLVSEDNLMEKPQGQANLARFFADKNFMYSAGDSLDVNRFLKDILTGATPSTETANAWTGRSICERFMAAPRLRLIPDNGIVRRTILKALAEGKIVVRTADENAYDAAGCVRGPKGGRRRTEEKLQAISLDDHTLITTADSETAHRWLAVDERQRDGGKDGRIGSIQPRMQERVTVKDAPSIVAHAETRPLLKLRITAGTPADAQNLLSLALPFSADSLSLRVTVSGEVKEGGSVSFLAENVKPNHPLKPLTIAQTLFSSIGEGATFEAVLSLSFGTQGRTGMSGVLQNLRESAPQNIGFEADFDRPTEATT
jgi:hypothetical protein